MLTETLICLASVGNFCLQWHRWLRPPAQLAPACGCTCDICAEEFTNCVDVLVVGPQGGVPRRLHPRRRGHFDPEDLGEVSDLRAGASRQLDVVCESGEHPAVAPPPLADAPLSEAIAAGGGQPSGEAVGGVPALCGLPKELGVAPRGAIWYVLADGLGQLVREWG
ncbi:unnamed protein product, partial [Prorocentrum cordatum]